MQIADVQTIVRRLNQKPFELELRLIDFGEKTPLELLEILLSIFTSIDDTVFPELDVKSLHHNPKIVQSKLVPFLLSLEYPLLPKTEDEMDSFVRAVADGESEQVYSMLLYCLDNHSNLCEMAYLSKFITSVQIPLDITMTQRDEGLSDLAKRYQSLQQELHTLFGHHKAAKKEEEQWDETCRKNDLKTLQNERTVLHEKVREMEDRLTKNTESFGQLVMAASILRKEQNTQARLSERMEEQQRARKPNEIKLDNIESRLDTFQSLYGTRTGGVMNMTTVLNGLRREVTESTMIVRSDLVSDRSKLEAKIKQLERLNDRPPCTVEDLERVLSLKRNLEAEIDIKSKLLKEEEATNSHPNIEMFKKHVSVSMKKVKAREEAVEERQLDVKSSRDKVARLEKQTNSLREDHVTREIEMPDGEVLRGHEIASYVKDCKDIFKVEEDKQREISFLKEENSGLDKTIATINKRRENLDGQLRREEEKAGVNGYHDAQEQLKRVEKDSGEVNKVKGETLQEISDIVFEMTEILKKEREKLHPMIRQLKDARAEFKVLEHEHSQKKDKYDKKKSKLASDREFLEHDCKQLQADWMKAERDYHYLSNALELIMANIEKAHTEEKWRHGEEEMPGDFNNLEDLYDNTLAKQEKIGKQLRLEQRDIKENTSKNIKQKQMMTKLLKCLQLKLHLTQNLDSARTYTIDSLCDALMDGPI